MDVCEFNGRRLYNGLRFDHRLRLLWTPTSASRAVSTVGELLVYNIKGSDDSQYRSDGLDNPVSRAT